MPWVQQAAALAILDTLDLPLFAAEAGRTCAALVPIATINYIVNPPNSHTVSSQWCLFEFL